MYRKAMSKSHSRHNFSNGASACAINYRVTPMRGGFRI